MITLRLQLRGHTVDLARDGHEGVEKALAGDFDLVLMDMHMPKMDGHEAVQHLRGQGFDTTIVAVTASATSRDSEAALESGCDSFISKPIGDDFEDRVDAILAES